MKTIRELKSEFSSIKDKRIPRAEKLPLVRSVLREVEEVEKAAIKDFSFPLDEIRAAKDFIAEVETYLR